MKKTQFKELLQSVEEMDAIVRGARKPSRMYNNPTSEWNKELLLRKHPASEQKSNPNE